MKLTSQHDRELSERVARYVELDFRQLIDAKLGVLRRSPKLHSLFTPSAELPAPAAVQLGDAACQYLQIPEAGYMLLPCDLRSLAAEPSHGDVRSLLRGFVDTSLPTIILGECVLSYLEPEAIDGVLRWLCQDLLASAPKLSLLSYDIALSGKLGTNVEPSRQVVSEFGTVMLNNLRTRGLAIPGARASTQPIMHGARLERAIASATPHDASVSSSVQTLWSAWEALSQDTRDWLSRIERLDEVEELELLLSHYCFAEASVDRAREIVMKSEPREVEIQ